MPSCGMSQSVIRASVPTLAISGAAPAGDCDLVALRDQAHAERPVVLEARLRHVDVTLLEHLERQQAAREQIPSSAETAASECGCRARAAAA